AQSLRHLSHRGHSICAAHFPHDHQLFRPHDATLVFHFRAIRPRSDENGLSLEIVANCHQPYGDVGISVSHL
ncbi:hypothetical protein M514_22645, partial [Trichuris suis]